MGTDFRRLRAAPVGMAAPPQRLLGIYLADHLAAATAGVELARRSTGANAGTPFGDALGRLATEIEDDRRTLRRVVADVGFSESRPKEALAWAGEKLGRLKLNGQLRGYSPLSRVLELEALSVGIAGKLALWETLQTIPGLDLGVDLDQLVERARRQRTEVESLRKDAVRLAFAGGEPA
jgi:hypothetical protein